MSFKPNDLAAKSTTPATKSEAAHHPEMMPPSFHGNFDLYAMELPFIRSKFTPEHDYAALLNELRYHQAKPDSSAQIYLPDTDEFSAGVPGRLRSLPVEDPLEGMPYQLELTSLALRDSVSFTACETTEDALYSSAAPVSSARRTPGMTATIVLADDECGVIMTESSFKMRRAWVNPDGKDEVFSVYIACTSACACGILEDDYVDVRLPFWGIRARVGPDGREIGLGTTGEDDENMDMRTLRLSLSRAALNRDL
ncbi:hypothetical protein GSI_08451 [Ganoderma sinense ZZ0214-1]|uniref:Uncharacterized protein n=1 Tax=Ganoderma sinense ZZ0214-1 TaxID=1077348 RepID=A0A2G8S3W2_9APHY|nr:hypothetical protein GSI_08451 [Ganoderma sinense ZZ0214-1]